MRPGPLVVAICAAIALGVPGAVAGTGYDVTIVAPGAVAKGGIQVRATVSGTGIGDMKEGAFHVRFPGGSWSQGSSALLSRTGEASFASTQVWDTTGMTNGTYEIEVRIWGDLPPYRPDDRATFSWTTAEVRVDNAPPAPGAPSVTTSAGGAWLQWAGVPSAERSDFLGYRVWALAQSPCPSALAPYRDMGRVRETALALADLAPGYWCFQVTAERESAVTGLIASAPSGAAGATVPAPSGGPGGSTGGGGPAGSGGGPGGKGGSSSAAPGGWVTGAAEVADPPPPPSLGSRESPASAPPGADLGTYDEDLPYGQVTVTELAEGDDAPREAGSVFGSLATRDRARAFGGGLLLAALAVHLRVFLGRRRPLGRAR